MFPENLVQACFQQIQTVYKVKKRKNATAAAMQLTTTSPAGYEEDYYDFYRDVEESTTASFNLSGIQEEDFERSLKYADGINVLGTCTDTFFTFNDSSTWEYLNLTTAQNGAVYGGKPKFLFFRLVLTVISGFLIFESLLSSRVPAVVVVAVIFVVVIRWLTQ